MRLREELLTGQRLRACRDGFDSAVFSCNFPGLALVFVHLRQYESARQPLQEAHLRHFVVVVTVSFDHALQSVLSDFPSKMRPELNSGEA